MTQFWLYRKTLFLSECKFVYNKDGIALGQEIEELERSWLVASSPILQSVKYVFPKPRYTDPPLGHIASFRSIRKGSFCA